MNKFDVRLDRGGSVPLFEQLRGRIAGAIMDGSLAPDSRLPSWRDLAVQLGIARGTVRSAYEALADAQLVVAAGARGTRVAATISRAPRATAAPRDTADPDRDPDGAFPYFAVQALPGQIGVPSQRGFPTALWNRVVRATCRPDAFDVGSYPDPCGERLLREQIAAHLVIARGLSCHPGRIVITSGYAGGLALVLRALGLTGAGAWVEDPGYPVAGAALLLAGMAPIPVPVDDQGLDIAQGRRIADDARLAIVTPGQQAPLGMPLSGPRRTALLEWAVEHDAWIIEDDYLGDLQLKGHAAPALAARDADRVIHIGTLSKTMTPTLRLGFVVVPPDLLGRVSELAALTAPAPGLNIQLAMAHFIRDGHYARHLRRMKVRYTRTARMLREIAAEAGIDSVGAGLAVILALPTGIDDVACALHARSIGIAASSLSHWYADRDRAGLLVGITNIDRPDDIARYRSLIAAVVAMGHDAYPAAARHGFSSAASPGYQ